MPILGTHTKEEQATPKNKMMTEGRSHLDSSAGAYRCSNTLQVSSSALYWLVGYLYRTPSAGLLDPFFPLAQQMMSNLRFLWRSMSIDIRATKQVTCTI